MTKKKKKDFVDTTENKVVLDRLLGGQGRDGGGESMLICSRSVSESETTGLFSGSDFG